MYPPMQNNIAHPSANPLSIRLLRSFRIAAWLGWQIESNWTDPFLFAIYSVVKPLASAAILVVMYAIITQSNFASPIFPYIYLGNAFYTYVGAVMAGISWAVMDDREHYKTLKYMYVAPISIPMYLIGRGVAKFIVGSISVFITILFGVLFLQVKIDLATVNWPLFIAALLVGVVMLAMMGLLLAGLTLLIAITPGSWARAWPARCTCSAAPSFPSRCCQPGCARWAMPCPSLTGLSCCAARWLARLPRPSPRCLPSATPS